MPEDFEKQVQQQGAGYRITPREDVWNRISNELDNKKKRRLGWWWFPIGLAGTIIPVLLFTGILSTGKQTNPSVTPRQERASFSTVKEQSSGNGKNTTNFIDPAISTAPAETPPVNVVQEAGSMSLHIKENTENLSYINPTNASTEKESAKFIMEASLDSSAFLLKNENTASLLPANVEQATAIVPAFDLLPKKQPDAFKIPMNNSNSIVVNGQKSLRHKGFWQIELAAGLSNIESGAPLLRSAAYQDSYFNNSPLPGNGSVGSQVPGTMYRPKAGAAYSAALIRVQPLSYRWTISAGIGFSHLRFTQHTGARKDTSFSTQFAGFNNKSLSHFYRAGNTQEHPGYFSRITLSSAIAYQLPVFSNRISLKTGIQAGYNVRAAFLVPDHSTGTYLPLSSAKKAFSASVSGGITYHTKQQYQFSLQGIYDITRAYSPVSNTSNYWRQWQFSTGIPILFKK
ncbi:MAG: hypothetical protein ACO1NW_04025 [Chitinophagaceae bacterium]